MKRKSNPTGLTHLTWTEAAKLPEKIKADLSLKDG